MSKKDELLRKIEELQRQEKEARRQKPEQEYKPRGMRADRMPLGCWLWVLAATGAVIYGIAKLV